MTQGERWSAGPVEQYPDELDPHATLFGLDDAAAADEGSRSDARRAERDLRRRRRRRGRLALIVGVVLVAALGVVGVTRLIDHFRTPDYAGTGSGTAVITVAPGDTAAAIGSTLQRAGVVESAKAFVAAATADSRSSTIQPGTYRLRQHMSGRSALLLLLDPSARDAARDTVVTEGATSLDVRDRLVAVLGAGQQPAIVAAFAHPGKLTLPRGYAPVGGAKLSSVEGFLYPATYTFDASTTPTDALQQMVSQFIEEDRRLGFAAGTNALHLTPYEALIIASIAQSEAKYPQDMPKVARTILNRLKIGHALQFDSTSSYACKLAGTASNACIYDKVNSPYNTYRNTGLPPTPIDNPGEPALHSAIAPTPGSWLYFVNIDAQGHLGFFTSYRDFQRAAALCARNHWGCG